jgi:hypothetical protein
MYKCLFLIWFTIGLTIAAKAQQPDTAAAKTKGDSIRLKRDSLKSKKFVPKITREKVYHPDSLHDPHKAVMRSLMIPGWGQLYNHRWWKLPFIYTGIGLLIDGVVFNQHYYSIFLQEDIVRQHGVGVRNPLLQYVSDADVDNYTNSYRRYRDLCILGTLGAWGIQMIDAYIDAKFMHSYTMDNNLSFKVSPGIMNQPAYAFSGNGGAYIPALTITFTLK